MYLIISDCANFKVYALRRAAPLSTAFKTIFGTYEFFERGTKQEMCLRECLDTQGK